MVYIHSGEKKSWDPGKQLPEPDISFPFLPAVKASVKLQYMDNIRWIREAAKHQLVRA